MAIRTSAPDSSQKLLGFSWRDVNLRTAEITTNVYNPPGVMDNSWIFHERNNPPDLIHGIFFRNIWWILAPGDLSSGNRFWWIVHCQVKNMGSIFGTNQFLVMSGRIGAFWVYTTVMTLRILHSQSGSRSQLSSFCLSQDRDTPKTIGNWTTFGFDWMKTS